MKKSAHLVLADPLRLVAEGLGGLLRERYDRVDLVTEGRAVLEIATTDSPDLVLTAVSIPEVGGLKVIRRLHRAQSKIPVVILADSSDQDCARAAFEAGARGFLSKTATKLELFNAVEEVLAGGLYMPPTMAGKVMLSMFTPAPDPSKGPMTPKEQEIAELVAQGLETSEIASRLYTAEVTVRTHLRRILRKLGLRNRVELARHVLARKADDPYHRARLVS